MGAPPGPDSGRPAPGLILARSAPPAWDSALLTGPRVLRTDDGQWRMWYTGRDAGFEPATRLPTGRIGLAASRDGQNWVRVPGPGSGGSVLEPTVDPDRFDSGHIGAGQVFSSGGTLVMWYFGGRAAPAFPLMAGRARSLDGIGWQRDWGPHAGALVAPGFGDRDGAMIGWPMAVADGHGGWLLYYTAPAPDRGWDRDQGRRIHGAASRDGQQWIKLGALLEPAGGDHFDAAGVGAAQVFRHEGRWLMLYEGADRRGTTAIGLAESEDGRSWTRVTGRGPGGAVFAPAADPGAWDAGGVGTPWCVPLPGGSLNLYYGGRPRSSRLPWRRPGTAWQIGLAHSTGDATHWVRHGVF